MRLIDADALIQTLVTNGWLKMNALKDRTEMIAVQSAIDAAPTITPPPNQPLTPEELREMEIREWCWIEIIIPSAFRKVESCYYCKFSDYKEDREFCCGWPGTVFSFDYVEYGKTWMAYRRKPEN